jgi:hypothetical protein
MPIALFMKQRTNLTMIRAFGFLPSTKVMLELRSTTQNTNQMLASLYISPNTRVMRVVDIKHPC